MALPRRLLLPLAGALALSGAPAAHAAVTSASADDPRDGTTTAARDLQQVRTSFDSDAGRWSVTVRLWEPANEAEWSMINATLWIPGATTREGPCSGQLTSVASMRASTRPSSTSVGASAGTYDDANPWGGTGPTAMQSATKSVSDGEVTLTGQDSRLVGRTAACVTLTLTYQNTLQDSIAGGVRFPDAAPPSAPADPSAPPAGPGEPAGPIAPAEPGATPFHRSMLRLVSAQLRTGRDWRVTTRLRPLDRAITGSARLRTVKGGRTLGTASWRARAGRQIVLRIRLNRAGRRMVRRTTRSVPARLVLSARPAGAVVSRTLAVRVRTVRR